MPGAHSAWASAIMDSMALQAGIIGLYFLPRLRGVKLARSESALLALALMAVGILLRTVAQPLLAMAAPGSEAAEDLRVAVPMSAALELVAAGILASLLWTTAKTAPPLPTGAPAYPVMPLLGLAAASFAVALVVNFGGTVSLLVTSESTVPVAWDLFSIQLLLYGLALPMDRRPTRKSYPDYGEYGRFELLVYSAFAWLALAALMGLIGMAARRERRWMKN
ncbi:MAG: hypothetical protein WCF84_06770 [Anaerolineae bacterium]